MTQDPLNDIARLDDPAFYAGDVHPVYDRLRAEAPVFWYEPGRLWALSRYADVRTALTLPQRFRSGDGIAYGSTRGRGG